MKPIGQIVLCLFAAALLLVMPPTLSAQKDFNQTEKETVEKYKRAKVHFLKSVEHLKKGKVEKARKEADACLEIFPGYADAHLLLAQLQYQQGHYEDALQKIETAKSAFDTFNKFYAFSYQEYLTRLREERDRRESQISDLGQMMENAPSADEKRRLQDQIDKAKQNLTTLDNRLRNPIPDTIDLPAEYHFIHGNILFKMKRFDQAQGFYLAAVQADPGHANAYNNLINIFFAKGDSAQALKYLKQAEDNGVKVIEGLKKAVLERQKPQ